jgi:hypothetical protein
VIKLPLIISMKYPNAFIILERHYNACSDDINQA